MTRDWPTRHLALAGCHRGCRLKWAEKHCQCSFPLPLPALVPCQLLHKTSHLYYYPVSVVVVAVVAAAVGDALDVVETVVVVVAAAVDFGVGVAAAAAVGLGVAALMMLVVVAIVAGDRVGDELFGLLFLHKEVGEPHHLYSLWHLKNEAPAVQQLFRFSSLN